MKPQARERGKKKSQNRLFQAPAHALVYGPVEEPDEPLYSADEYNTVAEALFGSGRVLSACTHGHGGTAKWELFQTLEEGWLNEPNELLAPSCVQVNKMRLFVSYRPAFLPPPLAPSQEVATRLRQIEAELKRLQQVDAENERIAAENQRIAGENQRIAEENERIARRVGELEAKMAPTYASVLDQVVDLSSGVEIDPTSVTFSDEDIAALSTDD